MIYLNHLLRASAAILVLCVPARADAIADLASFSAFKVDLDKLAGGAVQSARRADEFFARAFGGKPLCRSQTIVEDRAASSAMGSNPAS